MLNFSVTYKKPDEELKDLNNSFLEHNKIIMNIQNKLNTNYNSVSGAYSDNVYRDPNKLMNKMINYYKPEYVKAQSKALEIKPTKLDVDIEEVFDNILKKIKASDKISKIKPTKVKKYDINEYSIVDTSKFLTSKQDREEVINKLFDKTFEEKILARRQELSNLGLKTDDIDRVIITTRPELKTKIQQFDEVKKELLNIYGTLTANDLANTEIINKIENTVTAINNLEAKLTALPIINEKIIKKVLDKFNVKTPDDLEENQEAVEEIAVNVDQVNNELENDVDGLNNKIIEIQDDVNAIKINNDDEAVNEELEQNQDNLENNIDKALEDVIPDAPPMPQQKEKLKVNPKEKGEILEQLTPLQYIESMEKYKNELGINYDILINILNIINNNTKNENERKEELNNSINFKKFNLNNVETILKLIEGFENSSTERGLIKYSVEKINLIIQKYKEFEYIYNQLIKKYTNKEFIYKNITDDDFNIDNVDITNMNLNDVNEQIITINDLLESFNEFNDTDYYKLLLTYYDNFIKLKNKLNIVEPKQEEQEEQEQTQEILINKETKEDIIKNEELKNNKIEEEVKKINEEYPHIQVNKNNYYLYNKETLELLNTILDNFKNNIKSILDNVDKTNLTKTIKTYFKEIYDEIFKTLKYSSKKIIPNQWTKNRLEYIIENLRQLLNIINKTNEDINLILEKENYKTIYIKNYNSLLYNSKQIINNYITYLDNNELKNKITNNDIQITNITKTKEIELSEDEQKKIQEVIQPVEPKNINFQDNEEFKKIYENLDKTIMISKPLLGNNPNKPNKIDEILRDSNKIYNDIINEINGLSILTYYTDLIKNNRYQDFYNIVFSLMPSTNNKIADNYETLFTELKNTINKIIENSIVEEIIRDKTDEVKKIIYLMAITQFIKSEFSPQEGQGYKKYKKCKKCKQDKQCKLCLSGSIKKNPIKKHCKY